MSHMERITVKNPILKGGDLFVILGFMDTAHSTTHYGTDIRTSTIGVADEIIAIEDGEIVEVKRNIRKTLDNKIQENQNSPDAPGNYVTIKHNDKYSSRYGHIAFGSIKVNVGDFVKKGDVIGTMGLTGLAEEIHCHFEVWENGVRIDGEAFITGDNSFESAAEDLSDHSATYTVLSSYLNIRIAPSLSAKLAGAAIKKGTVLKDNGKPTVKANDYTWINVTYNDFECWVAKEFLEII